MAFKMNFFLGLICALDAAAMAQQPLVPLVRPPELQLGDIVVTLDRCVLQDGQATTNLPQGAQLRVIDLSGDWAGCSVMVNGRVEKGWLKKWLVAKVAQADRGNALPSQETPSIQLVGWIDSRTMGMTDFTGARPKPAASAHYFLRCSDGRGYLLVFENPAMPGTKLNTGRTSIYTVTGTLAGLSSHLTPNEIAMLAIPSPDDLTKRDLDVSQAIVVRSIQPYRPGAVPTDISVGDTVVTLENVKLRLGQQVLAEVAKGAQLQVRGISGDWVDVVGVLGGREQEGWVEERFLKIAYGSPAQASQPMRESSLSPAQQGMTPAAEKEIAIELGNGIKLELMLIPAGEFLMGSPDSDKDAQSSEKPRHRVRITKAFYLGKYLVTQEQWEAVMGNNPSDFKGPKNPVENVRWEDIQQFIIKLNVKPRSDGGRFQLPTEAQWEYACRAGSTTRYYFGDDETRLGDYAWYQANSDGHHHPVGLKKPNPWGLYDMHGNVLERCRDSIDTNWTAAPSTAVDPEGLLAAGAPGAMKGGAFTSPAIGLRAATRGTFDSIIMDLKSSSFRVDWACNRILGFRVAIDWMKYYELKYKPANGAHGAGN